MYVLANYTRSFCAIYLTITINTYHLFSKTLPSASTHEFYYINIYICYKKAHCIYDGTIYPLFSYLIF